MGARIVAPTLAREILTLWLEAGFDGDRHQRRIEQVTQIEEEEAKR
jgi:ribose 5-phosphate isomerase B